MGLGSEVAPITPFFVPAIAFEGATPERATAARRLIPSSTAPTAATQIH